MILFRHMNIGQKILLPFFVLLSVLVVTFATLTYNLQQKKSTLTENNISTQRISRLTDELSRLESQTEFHVLSYRFRPDRALVEDIESIETVKAGILDSMSSAVSSDAERELVKNYLQAQKDASVYRRGLISAIEQGQPEQVERQYSRWVIKRENINATLSDLVAYTTHLLNENSILFTQVVRQLTYLYIGFVFLTMLFIFLIYRYLRQNIIFPLRQLTDSVERMDVKNLESKLDTAPNDEIGMLQRSYVRMTQRLQESYADLHKLAYHDPLTGLANRQSLEERLDFAISIARRHNTLAAILLIDLDRFKNINDSLGHDIGDQVLTQVAGRLRSILREEDVVARLGGDEFVVLLPEVASVDDAALVAKKILQILEESVMVKNNTFYLTASVGVALFPEDGADAPQLLKNADIALYGVKSRGRNGYQFYRHTKSNNSAQRMRLEQDLREALGRRQLALHYQPIVDLKKNSVTRVEALLRWRHPELGMVPADQVISIAEESGLIHPIGRWALRQACEDWKLLRAAGNDSLRVSLNLSAIQFMESTLLEFMQKTFVEAECNPDMLEVEITESLAMENVEYSIRKIKELKDIGIGITLDDFGKGHSSLSYLKSFPIKRLKVDRSFVRDCIVDPQDASIIRAIVSMSHSLGIKVAAEGVETETQYAFLKSLGCDYLQGFYLAKPLPLGKLVEWLQVRKQAHVLT